MSVELLAQPQIPRAVESGGGDTYVEVRSVSKSFGENEVLRNIDLAIPRGEFVAVVGRSGCGKSTLLRILAGLDRPTSGDVLIEGATLSGLNSSARVMFQDSRLMPWLSVLDNVGLGLQGQWKERARAVLTEVGLESRAKDWPRVLSGGQRQRVALARALASEPPFLLLDEPLGALDALTKLEMQSLLERVWSRHRFTALLITHDIEEAVVLADRVLLIEDGQFALDIPVPLDRPRDRGTSEFIEIRQRVLSRIASIQA